MGKTGGEEEGRGNMKGRMTRFGFPVRNGATLFTLVPFLALYVRRAASVSQVQVMWCDISASSRFAQYTGQFD